MRYEMFRKFSLQRQQKGLFKFSHLLNVVLLLALLKCHTSSIRKTINYACAFHQQQNIADLYSINDSIGTAISSSERKELFNISSTQETLRLVLMVTDICSMKRNARPNQNISIILESIRGFKHSNYGGIKVHLDINLFTYGHCNEFNTTFDALNSLIWPHGEFRLHQSAIWGGLEQLFQVYTPSASDNTAFALVDINLLDDLHPEWYSFVLSAKKRYSKNPSIIGYAVHGKLANELRASITGENERNVYIQQSLNSAPIFVPQSALLWNSFLQWLHRNRADWFLWPNSFDKQRREGGIRSKYNNPTQASWQFWLSRFAATYDVYMLHHLDNIPIPLSPLQVFEKRKSTNFLKVSINGSNVISEQSSSRISISKVLQITQIARENGDFVSITILNRAFLETARSWLCNVDTGGFRPPGVVWIATDEESYEEIKKIPDTHAIYINDMKGAENGAAFGNPAYWLLMLERTNLIRDILNQGCTVFLFETDQVWLRDPMPFINRVLGSGGNIDLIGTVDLKEIAGNFLIFRPTLTMRKVYSEVYRHFESEYKRRDIAKNNATSVSYMQNDQSILTKLVLSDAGFRSKYPVSFRVLDSELFACGKWYEGEAGAYSSARSRSPVVINNNYVGLNLKTSRLKKFGHWFLTNGTCDSQIVRTAIAENDRRRQRFVTAPMKAQQLSNTGDQLRYSTAFTDFESEVDIYFISQAINSEMKTNNK